MSVLAIIPARAGSKGIPGKNFKLLAGETPVNRAVLCALNSVNLDEDGVILTSDVPCLVTPEGAGVRVLRRPPELAQDDTPMIDVVKHALAEVPGPADQIIMLLQPTQPLRKLEHVRAAIALLGETPPKELYDGVDSVVTVTELPASHHPEFACAISHGFLDPWRLAAKYDKLQSFRSWRDWSTMPACRQSVEPAYIRDGTAYVFWRQTVREFHNLYGAVCLPLIIPHEDTCPLDTPEDWAEAERRLRDRED